MEFSKDLLYHQLFVKEEVQVSKIKIINPQKFSQKYVFCLFVFCTLSQYITNFLFLATYFFFIENVRKHTFCLLKNWQLRQSDWLRAILVYWYLWKITYELLFLGNIIFVCCFVVWFNGWQFCVFFPKYFYRIFLYCSIRIKSL